MDRQVPVWLMADFSSETMEGGDSGMKNSKWGKGGGGGNPSTKNSTTSNTIHRKRGQYNDISG